MRRSLLWGLMMCCLVVCLLSILFYSHTGVQRDRDIHNRQLVVAALQLTDLSLCSEARYTRHPTQADLFSAFQDSPGAFEHFPTGSIILPRVSGFSGRVQVLLSTKKGE